MCNDGWKEHLFLMQNIFSIYKRASKISKNVATKKSSSWKHVWRSGSKWKAKNVKNVAKNLGGFFVVVVVFVSLKIGPITKKKFTLDSYDSQKTEPSTSIERKKLRLQYLF